MNHSTPGSFVYYLNIQYLIISSKFIGSNAWYQMKSDEIKNKVSRGDTVPKKQDYGKVQFYPNKDNPTSST